MPLKWLNSHELLDYSTQGVVAVAFHPGGVAGTKVANNAPEWLRKTFRDTRELFLPRFKPYPTLTYCRLFDSCATNILFSSGSTSCDGSLSYHAQRQIPKWQVHQCPVGHARVGNSSRENHS